MNLSATLVQSLNEKKYAEAKILWEKGIRMTFPKAMIEQAKNDRDMELLIWLYIFIRPELSIDDLKWAFKYGNECLIDFIWGKIPEPDIIDIIDILYIIASRGEESYVGLLNNMRTKPNTLWINGMFERAKQENITNNSPINSPIISLKSPPINILSKTESTTPLNSPDLSAMDDILPAKYFNISIQRINMVMTKPILDINKIEIDPSANNKNNFVPAGKHYYPRQRYNYYPRNRKI